MWLQTLLLTLLAASTCSTVPLDRAAISGGGWITVALANLSNPDGILSNTGQKCDLKPECDPFAVVSLGTSEYGKHLMNYETQVWKNSDNLLFVFLNETVAVNQSIPSPLHLFIDVEDKSIHGNTLIGRFQHTFHLQQPGIYQVTLSSKNHRVSLVAQVTIVCFKFYGGPTCADYCPDGTESCIVGHREISSVNGSQTVKQGGSIVYWVIPGFGGAMLLVVLLASAIRICRAYSTKNKTTRPGTTEAQRQSPTSSAASFALRMATLDSGRFRNPVYGSMRRQQSVGYNRSCSVTTQVSTVPTISAGVAATVTVEDTATTDDYEDLDAIRRQHTPPPNLAGTMTAEAVAKRPLPPLGAF